MYKSILNKLKKLLINVLNLFFSKSTPSVLPITAPAKVENNIIDDRVETITIKTDSGTPKKSREIQCLEKQYFSFFGEKFVEGHRRRRLTVDSTISAITDLCEKFRGDFTFIENEIRKLLKKELRTKNTLNGHTVQELKNNSKIAGKCNFPLSGGDSNLCNYDLGSKNFVVFRDGKFMKITDATNLLDDTPDEQLYSFKFYDGSSRLRSKSDMLPVAKSNVKPEDLVVNNTRYLVKTKKNNYHLVIVLAVVNFDYHVIVYDIGRNKIKPYNRVDNLFYPIYKLNFINNN